MVDDRNIQQDNVSQKAPISGHPAFPWMIGLWFAALFGLGTMVLPSQMLAKGAGAIGLSAVFPDGIAHAILALLAAALGLGTGLALAARVADALKAASTPRLRDSRKGRSQPPRPLSVDDIGEAAIAPSVIAAADEEPRKPIPGRRRALAVAEDTSPIDLPFNAPLPGDEAVAPPPLPVDDRWTRESLTDFAVPAFRSEPEETLDLSSLVPEVKAPEPYVPAFDTRKPRDITAPQPVEPVSRPRTPQPIDAPLEDLGIVQLTERLGRAMQLRVSARKERAATEGPTLAALTLDREMSTGDDTRSESAFVPPPVVPDALRAFMESPPEDADAAPRPLSFASFKEDDEDDGIDVFAARPFGLSLSAMRPGEFDSADDSVAEEATADDLGHALEEPGAPAAPSGDIAPAADGAADENPLAAASQPADGPAQPAPQPVETERALRSALAKLQRMSGAV